MKCLWTWIALLFLASPALAGPNNGGTLFLHDAGLDYEFSVSDYCGLGSAPPSCDLADVEIDVDTPVVWKVYAAFHPDSNPRLKAVTFGIEYEAGGIAISAWGACAEFELAETGWPASGTGTALVFNQVQTGHLVECYWFAGYRELEHPQLLLLTGHPNQGGTFADDSVPAIVDPVAGYGSLGFGISGAPACPDVPPPQGACCAPDGSCMVTPEIGCDGNWLGEGTVCDPNPCPQLGACCDPEGGCTIALESACDGEWQGPGTVCWPNPCPIPPRGACCAPNGTCIFVFEMDCSGVWLEGTICTPNPCPPLGACCNPDYGTCTMTIEHYCSGNWLGEGTDCWPNPCPEPPYGACCAPNGSCTVTWEVHCYDLWMGAGTVCHPNPCPGVGACCTGMICIITAEPECSGDWMGPGILCEPDPCCAPHDADDPALVDRSNPANWLTPGAGIVQQGTERDNPWPGSTLLDNTDGSFENAFTWNLAGQAPPSYGAFAEGFESYYTALVGIRYMFTSVSGQFQDAPIDVYVWDSDGYGPKSVLSVTTGIHIEEPAHWPEITAHDIPVDFLWVHGRYFVGYWGHWPGAESNWYVAADVDGPGGRPRTNIAPGIGYPSGWQHVCIVWGYCQALGIGPYVEYHPIRVETTTWGKIKSIYKDLEATPANDR